MKAVLFDLDGTLLDTAADLAFALNRLRAEHGLTAMPFAAIRPIINRGAKGMLQHTLDIEHDDPNYPSLRTRFLELYEKHIADSTQFFPGMDDVLNQLETSNIPWGIVTNKLTKHTKNLLQALRIDHRPACIVCGDTLTTYKPDPAPILHACELLNVSPQTCLYIGDSESDVLASKAAGLKCLVAMYGYLEVEKDPSLWLADGYIHQATEILNWVNI